MRRRAFLLAGIIAVLAAASGTLWIASPTETELPLSPPLEAWAGDSAFVPSDYSEDLAPLTKNFRPQIYRSFCGPASIATVLRAYGAGHADQAAIFPSLSFKLETFYTGMSLAELAELANSVGLGTEIVYADTLDVDTFRERLKANLTREGDFVLVNYDRRILKQAGAGHISPVGAYDATRDAFLILDAAAYRYPFTWVPAPLLYQAVHTRNDLEHFRGVLFISGYRTRE